MTKDELVTRYLTGHRLTNAERSALAKQLGGAPQAAQAIRLAKESAAAACHDWQPTEPTVGWVAICYVKYKQVWRVVRDGQIVSVHASEIDARKRASRLASDANAEWRGMIAA